MTAVRSFECGIQGEERTTIIHHVTADREMTPGFWESHV